MTAPWHPHDGGPCPVPDDSTIVVRFRDTTTEGRFDCGFYTPLIADDWEWAGREQHPCDVVAFRFVSGPEVTTLTLGMLVAMADAGRETAL